MLKGNNVSLRVETEKKTYFNKHLFGKTDDNRRNIYATIIHNNIYNRTSRCPAYCQLIFRGPLSDAYHAKRTQSRAAGAANSSVIIINATNVSETFSCRPFPVQSVPSSSGIATPPQEFWPPPGSFHPVFYTPELCRTVLRPVRPSFPSTYPFEPLGLLSDARDTRHVRRYRKTTTNTEKKPPSRAWLMIDNN